MAHTSHVATDGSLPIPTEIRDQLGLDAGAAVVWEANGESAVIRKAKPLTIDELHRELFPDGPPPARTVEEMDEAVSRGIREKYGRRG